MRRSTNIGKVKETTRQVGQCPLVQLISILLHQTMQNIHVYIHCLLLVTFHKCHINPIVFS